MRTNKNGRKEDKVTSFAMKKEKRNYLIYYSLELANHLWLEHIKTLHILCPACINIYASITQKSKLTKSRTSFPVAFRLSHITARRINKGSRYLCDLFIGKTRIVVNSLTKHGQLKDTRKQNQQATEREREREKQ